MRSSQQEQLPPLSPISATRVRAQAIWRGPRNIEIRDNRGVLFHGWPTLTLELRPGYSDRLESRSVYANLFDRTQEIAVLRAVYWDGEAMQKSIRERKDKKQASRLKLAARFIQISHSHLEEWLSHFQGASVNVDDSCGDDRTIGIRRLRIERDYLTCVFEKIWLRNDSHDIPINQPWEHIWRQMSQALENEPRIETFTEDFWTVKSVPRYDFKAYDSNRIS